MNIVGQKIRDFRELLRLDMPTKGDSTISVESRLWEPRKEIIKLNQTPLTLLDATNGNGKLIATLPLGYVAIMGAVARGIVITTTSVLATTLKSSVLTQIGVGTAQQSGAGALSGTMQNIVGANNGAAPAVINTPTSVLPIPAPPAVQIASALQSSAVTFLNGSVTPTQVWLNFGVPTSADIIGDATILIDGEVEISYFLTAAVLRNE